MGDDRKDAKFQDKSQETLLEAGKRSQADARNQISGTEGSETVYAIIE